MSLYLWINLLSLSIPLVVSFHPRLKLYKKWKFIFPAILITMLPYVIWDIYFTNNGYWGFNEVYLNGIYFFDLPLEELLFFICIPYACIFTHEALNELFGLKGISLRWTKNISIFLLLVFTILAILFTDKAYTFVDMLFGLVILTMVLLIDKQILRKYYITFLFMLVPFFIVNGVLTGIGIVDEVVWYNNEENLGIRLATIPIEDSVYAFSLILSSLFFYKLFERNFTEIPSLPVE